MWFGSWSEKTPLTPELVAEGSSGRTESVPKGPAPAPIEAPQLCETIVLLLEPG
jgi:hypothetical protein